MTAIAPYTAFARIYDSVSGKHGLELFAPAYERILEREEVAPGIALDVACGTGLWCRRLAERGWTVVGLDRSREMLARAARRCRGLDVATVRGDMRDNPFVAAFDLVTCTFDSLNYVADDEALSRVLAGFVRALRPGGLALFDTNTSVALRKLWGTREMVQRAGRTVSVWSTKWRGGPRTNELKMEIFTPKRGREVYERAVEVHVERALDPAPVRRACIEAGFASVEPLDVETLERADRRTAKALFVATKAEPG